jgi:HEAT repeat protein
MESVAGMARDPDSTITQLAWIIRFIYNSVPDEALDDQRLLYALDSEDESVRLVATWAYSWIENISNQRKEQQLLGPVR